MWSEYGFKVDGWGSSWSQPDHAAEARRYGRLNKLKALLDALKAADPQAAEKALNELWSFDPGLKNDPYLIKIGDALSKKLLYLAQKIAVAMQADVRHFSAHQSPKPSSIRPSSDSASNPASGKAKAPAQMDQPIKKATSGEFGRIIDVTA